MTTKPNATYGEIRRNPGQPLKWETLRSDAYWTYRRQWSEYPQQGIVPEFPLCLDIETTAYCNLSCIMCPRTVYLERGEYPHGNPNGRMSFEFYKSLIDQGAEYGLPSVKLQYLGEPLAHADLPKQIAYAKQRGVLDVLFNTNATLLTEKKAREVLDAGVDGIFFSVDSLYADRYNEIRVGADYENVVANIIRFCEIKEAGGYDHVQTRVSLVVMENSVEELEAFADYWLQYVDLVGFGIYHEAGSTYVDSPYVPDFQCAQPFQRMFVMWDGICTPCCVDDHRGYPVGDARQTSLHDIWHGPTYRVLRAAHLAGSYTDIRICAGCYVPHTQLDGQVISLGSIVEEVEAIEH